VSPFRLAGLQNGLTERYTRGTRQETPAELLCFQEQGLVGAVGIENNTDRNLKDLEEMLRNAKALKRNNRKSKGILIGPSMAPRFFSTEIPSRAVLTARKLMSVSGPNLVARMAY